VQELGIGLGWDMAVRQGFEHVVPDGRYRMCDVGQQELGGIKRADAGADTCDLFNEALVREVCDEGSMQMGHDRLPASDEGRRRSGLIGSVG